MFEYTKWDESSVKKNGKPMPKERFLTIWRVGAALGIMTSHS